MKRTVQFTRYYYRTVTKEVDVPDNIPVEKHEKWIEENISVNPDEYADKPLNTEDDAMYVMQNI